MIFASDHPIIASSYWLLRKMIGPVIKYLFVLNVNGIRNIPLKGAAILAFNHQSFFDFICSAAVMPRNIHFLTAEKFFSHLWWKKLMIITGQIKVDRELHDKSLTHKVVEAHVRKGTLIGIFPEGTRSPYKDEMLKAFTGIAQFALKHNIPIIPVGIKGTYEIMAKHDSKPNFKKIVEINFGEPLYFHEHHHKHNDKVICTYVTENVIRHIERLSGKKYPHYEYGI